MFLAFCLIFSILWCGFCDECYPGCEDRFIGDGICDWECNVEACDFDEGDCDDFCSTSSKVMSGFEWLDGDIEYKEIISRVFVDGDTVTLIDGVYDPDYSFEDQDYSSDLDSYDPSKPGLFNPWDPLIEVVLGRIDNAGVPFFGPLVLQVIHTHSEAKNHLSVAYIREGEDLSYLHTVGVKQVEKFLSVFEERDIEVHRPKIFDFTKSVEGVYKEGYNNAMARDALLVIGNHFFPSRFAWRSRAMEISTYDEILEEAERLGAIVHRSEEPVRKSSYYVMPCVEEDTRKFLDKYEWPDRDCLYDDWKETMIDMFGEDVSGNIFCLPLTNEEAFFDAPDCEPIGNDVFCQLSITTNLAGLKYISKGLGKDYRVHILPAYEASPMHIDTHFMPLREGLIMVADKVIHHENLPSFFDDWTVLDAPAAEFEHNDLYYSGPLNNNFLLLDDHTVVIEKGYAGTKKALEDHGFETVSVNLFQSYNPIDGGPHCATADFWRDGSEYFE